MDGKREIICIGRPGDDGGIGDDTQILRLLDAESVAVSTLSSASISSQLGEIFSTMGGGSAVIKTGWMGDSETIVSLVKSLSGRRDTIICDAAIPPKPDAVEKMKQEFFPLVELLIVGAKETLSLTGLPAATPMEMETAAKTLLTFGAKSALVRGDALKNPDVVQDFWSDGAQSFWITAPRLDGKARGNKGALLACSIAAARAGGFDLLESLVLAWVQQSDRVARDENGKPPTFSIGTEDFPWISRSAASGQNPPRFPPIETDSPELYPIVDRFEWIRRLAPLGVRTIQLRIKDLEGRALEDEIARAAAFAAENGLRLFINDYWELAIKHGAYGVHLGQEDLAGARIDLIEKAGLRLGVSTHSYFEAAVAHGLRPSYAALGPVYFTKLKSMRFAPQGVQKLAAWKRMLGCPLVAIGGITLENAPEVLREKPDFISVVGDIANAPDTEARVRSWMELLSHVNNS